MTRNRTGSVPQRPLRPQQQRHSLRVQPRAPRPRLPPTEHGQFLHRPQRRATSLSYPHPGIQPELFHNRRSGTLRIAWLCAPSCGTMPRSGQECQPGPEPIGGNCAVAVLWAVGRQHGVSRRVRGVRLSSSTAAARQRSADSGRFASIARSAHRSARRSPPLTRHRQPLYTAAGQRLPSAPPVVLPHPLRQLLGARSIVARRASPPARRLPHSISFRSLHSTKPKSNHYSTR